jgi:hypothetical protein
MNKLILLLSCLFLTASYSFAQAGEQSGMIKTAKGILVVWNEPGNYYTVEIKGNKILPAEQPLLFQVDGKFFQIQTAEKKAFLKDSNDKNLDDKAILSAHRDWEGDYISGIIHSKLKIDSVWLKLANNMDVLAWSYNMPKVKDNQSAKRQLYLAVVKRDHVFLLNGAVTANDDEKEIQRLLLDTMNTMRSSDKSLSLKDASEQVMKEH